MKFETFENLNQADAWFKMNKYAITDVKWLFGKFCVTVSYMVK